MKLSIPTEPQAVKEYMDMIQRQFAPTPDADWDSLVVWAGNQLPKYLWNEWKDELKETGLTWQKFLKLLRYRTEIFLLWRKGLLPWEELVKEVKKMIEGPLGQELSKPPVSAAERFQEAFVRVPIYGAANAGTPSFLAEQKIEGYISVSKRIAGPKKVFAIRVSGNSMNMAEVNHKKIESGDFVIVDSETDLVDGDKVLAVIDSAATVKKFKQEGDRIVLFPVSSSDEHEPIYLTVEDNFVINGKIVDVLKSSK